MDKFVGAPKKRQLDWKYRLPCNMNVEARGAADSEGLDQLYK